MNNDDAQTLQSLKGLNAQLTEFNTLLADVLQSLNKDQLQSLKGLNAQIREFNALLVDISESLKKDALVSEVHQVTSPSA